MATKKATRMNSDKRMFVLHVIFKSGRAKLIVHETRDDAIDDRNAKLLQKNVKLAAVVPAERGASNTRKRSRG